VARLGERSGGSFATAAGGRLRKQKELSRGQNFEMPYRAFNKTLGTAMRILSIVEKKVPSSAPKKTPKHLCFGVFAVFAFGPQSCKIERCKNQGNAEWINNIIRKAVFQNVTENTVRKTYYTPLDKIYYR